VVESGWYEGELAATAYMTPRYAASVRKDPPVGPPGAIWSAWAAHRATTSVSASVEADPGGPRDTAVAAYRKVIATVVPHGTNALGDPNDIGTIDSATSNQAVALGDPAPTAAAGAPQSAGEWVGQPQVWVSYLVLSRRNRGAPWRVARSETTP
jgi:hypothetical protein